MLFTHSENHTYLCAVGDMTTATKLRSRIVLVKNLSLAVVFL